MCLTLFSWMLKEITQLKIVLGNILLLNLLMAITNMRLTSKNMVNKMPRSSLDSRNYHLFFKFHWTDTNTVPTKTRWLRTTNNSNLVKCLILNRFFLVIPKMDKIVKLKRVALANPKMRGKVWTGTIFIQYWFIEEPWNLVITMPLFVQTYTKSVGMNSTMQTSQKLPSTMLFKMELVETWVNLKSGIMVCMKSLDLPRNLH